MSQTVVPLTADLLCKLSPDLLCLAGLDGYFKVVNPAFERILGYPVEAILGQPFFDFVHPQDRDRTIAEMSSVAMGVPTERFVNRYRHADGSYRWIEWRSSNTSVKDLISAVGRDVTDRYRAQETTADFDFAALLQEHVFDGVVKISRAGEIDFATPNFARMLASLLQNLRGRNVLDLVIPADRERLATLLENVAPGLQCPTQTFEFLPAAGENCRLELRVVGLPGKAQDRLIVARDVTAWATAEAELGQTEQRLAMALKASRSGTWSWDPTQNRTIMQGDPYPSFPERSGRFSCTDQEFINRVHPEDRDSLSESVRGSIREDREIELDYRVILPSGEIRWIVDRGQVVKDEEGRLLRLTGVCWDITDRVRTERELSAAHRRLSLHLENSPLGMLEWDQQSVILRWSKQAEQIFGYKAEEILGRRWLDLHFVYEDDQETVDSMADSLFAGRQSMNVSVNRNYHRNGRIIWCEWFNSVLYNEDGTIVSVLSFMQDVTTRIEAERVIRRSREELESLVQARTTDLISANLHALANEVLLRSVLSSIPYSVGLIDAEANFTNLFSEHLIGLKGPRDSVVGSSLATQLPREAWSQCRLALQEVLDEGRVTDFEYEFPQGSDVRVIQIVLAPFDADAKMRQAVWIAADVTDTRAADRKIRTLTRDLQHAARLSTTGEMTAGIAHELHQPLMAIASFASGTRRRLTSGSFNVDELIHVNQLISDEALRAGDIIRKIHAFLRKQDPKFDQVDLLQVIEDSLSLVQMSLQAREAALIRTLPEQPVWVRGDRTQLTQVVLNLVLNAIDALGGLPRDRRQVAVHLMAQKGAAFIEVEDSGPGVPDELRSRIFDQFFTTKPSGLGLGLAISRSIVLAHGGQLEVDRSGELGGARFCVQLKQLTFQN